MDDIKQTIKKILLRTSHGDLKVVDVSVEPALEYPKKSFLIVAVHVKFIKDGGTKVVKLIAKRIMKNQNERIKVSFVKEVQMYRLVIPEYIKIQTELSTGKNLLPDLFAKYYGCDYSFGNPDSLKTFLIKDLRPQGYAVANPRNYLDMAHSRLLIDRLAHFHAIGIALKEKHPTIFEVEFKDILKPALLSDYNPKAMEFNILFRKKLKRMLSKYEKLKKFSEPVDKIIEKIDEIKTPPPNEPFATLTHNDLWKLNLLFKYNFDKSTGKSNPIDVKLIDFQFCIYNSPARDLLHFVYTSTQVEVINEFKNLSLYYYENFVKHLKILKCKSYKEFTMEKFNEEIKYLGWTKMKHTIMMNKVVSKKLRKMKIERWYNIFVSFENNGWFDL